MASQSALNELESMFMGGVEGVPPRRPAAAGQGGTCWKQVERAGGWSGPCGEPAAASPTGLCKEHLKALAQ
jgi:hypothetical protein